MCASPCVRMRACPHVMLFAWVLCSLFTHLCSCERHNNVTILDPAPYTRENAEAEEFIRVVSFECRGVEIAEFAPMVRLMCSMALHFGCLVSPRCLTLLWVCGQWTFVWRQNGWAVKATSTTFNDVDFEEGEWAEYDGTSVPLVHMCTVLHARLMYGRTRVCAGTEDADESVSIISIEHKIEVSHASDGHSKRHHKRGKKKHK